MANKTKVLRQVLSDLLNCTELVDADLDPDTQVIVDDANQLLMQDADEDLEEEEYEVEEL